MNFKRIGILYKKELLELVRNTALLVILIIFPVIVYPLAMLYSTQVSASRQEKLNAETSLISIAGGEILPELSALLQEERKIKITVGENKKISPKNHLFIKIEKDESFFDKQNQDNYAVNVYFDSTDSHSRNALSKLQNVLSDYSQELLYRRLDSHGLTSDILSPLKISNIDSATEKKIAGSQIGDFLPFLLVMFILTGTMQVAVDITAGEKERKTIQTLLLTGITRSEALIGKLAVVITCALVTTAVNIMSILLTLSFISSKSDVLGKFSFQPDLFFYSFLLILPLVALLATLLVALGIMAKNQIEASLYSMPVILLAFFPLIMTSGDDGNNLFMSLIPVANTALSLKGLLMGTATPALFAGTVFSNLLYALIIFLLSLKLFKNEDIAFGGVSDIMVQSTDKKEITPLNAILLYCVSMFLYVYIGGRLQENNIYTGLVYSQILFLFLPALFIARKPGLKEAFAIKKTSFIYLILSPILAVATIFVSSAVGEFQRRFIPMPAEIADMIKKLVDFDYGSQTLVVTLVVALTPAVFEELFFRGVILSGFKKHLNKITLALLIGFLFAVFHLDAYSFLALVVAGSLLSGWRIKTDSIFPVMIFHFTFNALQAFMHNYQWIKGDVPFYVSLLCLLFIIAVFVVPGRKRSLV